MKNLKIDFTLIQTVTTVVSYKHQTVLDILPSKVFTKQSRARLVKLTQIKQHKILVQQQTVYLNVLHQFTCARHRMLMACNAWHVTLAIENKFTSSQKRRQEWDKGGP